MYVLKLELNFSYLYQLVYMVANKRATMVGLALNMKDH